MKIILIISTLFVISLAKSQRNVLSWCGRDRVGESHDLFMGKRFKFPEANEIEGRIWGGQPASPGQFGFYTELMSFDGRWMTPCGGSLIRYNWVLTAGQCIVCARNVRLIFGQNDKNGGPISWLTDVNDPNHIKYHQNYNPWDFANNPFVNDIGLIYLQEARWPILLPNVRSIDFSRNVDELYVGYRGYAMGYGGVEFPSTRLNFVDMNVITNDECGLTFTNVIVNSNLCTDTRHGKSTCQGDAGGPLVIDDGFGNFTLIGIGSFRHRDGCNLRHPAVFTRVTSFIDWIDEQIASPPELPGQPVLPPATDGCECFCHTCPVA